MSAQSPVPKDSPLWLAWQQYAISGEYANTKRWASHPEHVDGSLWAAFDAGFRAASSSSTPLSETPSMANTPNHEGIHQGPSGRCYRLWANGDGIDVFRSDGGRMQSAGSHVPVVPLVDAPLVAVLIASHTTRGTSNR